MQLNMGYSSYCIVLSLFGVSQFVYGLFLYGAAELDILAVAVSLLWKNRAEAWTQTSLLKQWCQSQSLAMEKRLHQMFVWKIK